MCPRNGAMSAGRGSVVMTMLRCVLMNDETVFQLGRLSQTRFLSLKEAQFNISYVWFETFGMSKTSGTLVTSGVLF